MLNQAFSYNAKVQKTSWTSGLMSSSTRTFAGHTLKMSESQAEQSKRIGHSTGSMHAVVAQYTAQLLDFSPMPQSEVRAQAR